MDIRDLIDKTKDPKEFETVLGVLTQASPQDSNIDKNRKDYDGDHDILSDVDRRDKTVGSGTNARTVRYNKEIINMQRKIVNTAVMFLFGKPVNLVLNDDTMTKEYDMIINLWNSNKLDYFNKELARNLFVECKVAEYWYATKETNKPAKIRVAMFSKKKGYSIFPHYDEYGDMDAFTIKFETKDAKGKVFENVTIFTADVKITAVKQTSGWEVAPIPNLLGKIPIVYLEQDIPEWYDVASQIKRMEYMLSNFGDTNDYFGAPVLEVKGEVTNLPKKEEMGKVVKIAESTNALTGEKSFPGGIKFVTWDRAPEAIEKEWLMLKDIVYGMTNTPDLSFSNVKGLSNVSGITLRLMFLDAIFKALDKQEVFGPAISRRLSIMKSLLGIADVSSQDSLNNLDIEVRFGDILPTDVESMIKSISLARGGEPIISEETAVRMCPLVSDSEAEIDRLAEEKNMLKSFAESVQP